MMTFSQIKYERVDLQALKDQIAELTRRLKEAADFAQAEQAYLQMNELEGQAMHGMRTVAQIRRDIDTRDEFYDAEIKFYNRELPLVQPLKQAWTNELLRSNAERLKMGTIQTAKEAERGVVDLETIRAANTALIDTLTEVQKIQREGAQKRAEASIELGRLEKELRDKVLEINHP